MKFYRDKTTGVWHIGRHIMPPGSCRIEETSDNSICITSTDTSEKYFKGLVTELEYYNDQDELVNYTNLEDLVSKCCGFFAKASGDGGEVGDIKVTASVQGVPSGWMACNGASVGKLNYPALLSALRLHRTALVSLNATVGTTASTSEMFVGMNIEISGMRHSVTAINDSTTFSFSPAFGLSGFGARDLMLYPYGSADVNTFKLPNLAGRVPVGIDSAQAEFNAVGKSGGAKTHTLTIDQIPSHSHNAGIRGASDTNSNINNLHCGYGGSGGGTAANGGGQSHNNLQPYVTLNYIIKY